jgi:hypothetical protein
MIRQGPGLDEHIRQRPGLEVTHGPSEVNSTSLLLNSDTPLYPSRSPVVSRETRTVMSSSSPLFWKIYEIFLVLRKGSFRATVAQST